MASVRVSVKIWHFKEFYLSVDDKDEVAVRNAISEINNKLNDYIDKVCKKQNLTPEQISTPDIMFRVIATVMIGEFMDRNSDYLEDVIGGLDVKIDEYFRSVK